MLNLNEIKKALENNDIAGQTVYLDADLGWEIGNDGCQPCHTKAIALEDFDDEDGLESDISEWMLGMWPEDMVGSDTICQDLFRGTRNQWEQVIRDTDWYSDYCQKCDEAPMTEDEWVEWTLDECLIAWDGDLDYERI